MKKPSLDKRINAKYKNHPLFFCQYKSIEVMKEMYDKLGFLQIRLLELKLELLITAISIIGVILIKIIDLFSSPPVPPS